MNPPISPCLEINSEAQSCMLLSTLDQSSEVLMHVPNLNHVSYRIHLKGSTHILEVKHVLNYFTG